MVTPRSVKKAKQVKGRLTKEGGNPAAKQDPLQPFLPFPISKPSFKEQGYPAGEFSVKRWRGP